MLRASGSQFAAVLARVKDGGQCESRWLLKSCYDVQQQQQRQSRRRTFTSSSVVVMPKGSSQAPFTMMSESGFTPSQLGVRGAIQAITDKFGLDYWLERDRTGTYPHELYDELQRGQWIGLTLPTQYGGANLGISEACIMLQTIAESGAGVSGAQSIHANVYPMMPIIEFASDSQKQKWLPQLIQGQIRSCFMITEPNVGLETLKLKTKAEKKGDKWIINGSKVRVRPEFEIEMGEAREGE